MIGRAPTEKNRTALDSLLGVAWPETMRHSKKCVRLDSRLRGSYKAILRTISTWKPLSSLSSRLMASSGVSPWSMPPPGSTHTGTSRRLMRSTSVEHEGQSSFALKTMPATDSCIDVVCVTNARSSHLPSLNCARHCMINASFG